MTEPFTDTADTENAARSVNMRITRLEETVVVLMGFISSIRQDLGRANAPVAFDAPDGTVAIRDPDILAQEQATGMRGNAPHVPPPE